MYMIMSAFVECIQSCSYVHTFCCEQEQKKELAFANKLIHLLSIAISLLSYVLGDNQHLLYTIPYGVSFVALYWWWTTHKLARSLAHLVKQTQRRKKYSSTCYVNDPFDSAQGAGFYSSIMCTPLAYPRYTTKCFITFCHVHPSSLIHQQLLLHV